MTNIIAVMNPKGGVAKTTTTVSLASFLSRNFKVAVIDMDPQSSIKTHLGEECALKVFTAQRMSQISSLPQNAKAQTFDYLFIDTPASLDASRVQGVAAVSDFVIVPSKASTLDVTPSLRFIDSLLVPSQTSFKLLLTQVIPTSSHIESIREQLVEQKIPTFDTAVRQYQAYMQASEEQKSIFDLGYTASYARNDYRSVAHELLNSLQPIEVKKTLSEKQLS